MLFPEHEEYSIELKIRFLTGNGNHDLTISKPVCYDDFTLAW